MISVVCKEPTLNGKVSAVIAKDAVVLVTVHLRIDDVTVQVDVIPVQILETYSFIIIRVCHIVNEGTKVHIAWALGVIWVTLASNTPRDVEKEPTSHTSSGDCKERVFGVDGVLAQ